MTDRLSRDLASGVLHEVIADVAEAAAVVILPYWRVGT
ncbi:MAG: 3'(2'),5'-bisphosphate nucleotidase, partial [Alphaproteobacteria bacterium]